jgi:hypothetical protein
MTPFGKTKRQLALAIIGIGIYTFFTPIVVVEQPALNRIAWSPLEITVNVVSGKVRVPDLYSDLVLMEIGLLYLLMPTFLVAMYLPATSNTLALISGIGFLLSVTRKYWLRTFAASFGWEYWGQTHPGPAWWILPFIMPALLAVCFARHLDARPEEKRLPID